MRVAGSRCGALILVSLALTTACSDSTGLTETGVDDFPSIPGLTVSAPVPGSAGTSVGAAAASAAHAAFAAASGDESVVYISLAPGSLPAGFKATIHHVASVQSITAAIVNGGFDPVAISASLGDTLIVEVSSTSGDVIRAATVIAARRPPKVVRTSPPPKKRDVALNAIIVIVFSAPIDPTTLTAESVQLWRGATPVPGTVRFADAARLRAEFHPDALLAALTDYELVVREGIRDVNGLALDSSVIVPFTTGTIAPAINLEFASVSVGLTHSCGVTVGGAVYCWGDNDAGELGDGTTASRTTPVRVAGGLIFASVSTGAFHTCGVTTTGALYCWGRGRGYTLGVASTPEPVAEGFTFAAVSVSDFHACGVTTGGTAYCWGQAGMGELGDGTVYGGAPIARVAGGLTFAAVSAGVYSSCGVTTTGAAYCWGNNMLAALGTGSSTGPEQCQPNPFSACSTVPVAVAGGLTFRQVHAKVFAACGLTTSGTAYCWGSNLNDHLGFGTKTGPEQCAWDDSNIMACSRVPFAVPGSPNLVSLSDADAYSCGLTSTGVAYCWGYPQNVGDLNSNTAPVAVPGGLTFAMLSTGPYSTCGVTTAGVAYCWGANDHGQLGDGTTSYSSVPVEVAGQR